VPDPSERWTSAIACDGRIVPLLDVAQEDLGERRPVDHEVARLDAVEVHDRNDAAHHHRELRETRLVELLARQRRVGGAESHGLGLDLLDAAARTDRLVVEADAGLFLVRIRPLGIDRIGERGPCAGQIGGKRIPGGRDKRDRRQSCNFGEFH